MLKSNRRFFQRLFAAIKKWLFLVPFIVFLCLYGLIFSSRARIYSDRSYYLRYHIAEFEIKEKLSGEYKLVVFRKDKPVKGIGDRIVYDFLSGGDKSSAKFPIPWNAEKGFYEARVFHPDGKERRRFLPLTFAVTGREPSPVTFPLNAVTWENTKPLDKVKIPVPTGEVKSWKGIFDWIEFTGANTLLYLAGQTAFYEKSLPPDFPWIKNNMAFLDKMCDEARARKVRIGAWIASYIIIGARDAGLGYRYGIDYSIRDDALKTRRGISIGDEKRLRDIIKAARRIDVSDVDFIGLDYIRPVQGGLELVDDFLSEMQIKFPENLGTKEDRMLYLGREIYRDKNYKLMDLWNWWRAHKTSEIIERVREEVKSDKPLWIFLLSWQMGHQHGQDPVMFQDAGADFQTVMLYECDTRQFERLIGQWREYNARGVNFVVGNQVDFPVHQFTEDPPAPQEFGRRIREAKKVMKAKGVFVNDLSRALWGRKGPYSTVEWLTPVKEEFIKQPAPDNP
ncbi:MAG: hypothetical protein ABIH68_02685 [bacterium]